MESPQPNALITAASSPRSGTSTSSTPAPGNSPQPRRLQLSSTPRGAHLARLLVERQLDTWGLPRTCRVTDAVLTVTAELAANAITHGRTPGRDFAVRVACTATHIRVEVTDTRPDRLPPTTAPHPAESDPAESGHGLLLVAALADRWGCAPTDPYTKTVWAEIDRTPPTARHPVPKSSAPTTPCTTPHPPGHTVHVALTTPSADQFV